MEFTESTEDLCETFVSSVYYSSIVILGKRINNKTIHTT
jgi:hypothetical protein